MNRHFLRTGLAAALCASASFAQVDDIDWTSTIGGSFERVVAGHFSPDLFVDLVVKRDSNLVLVSGGDVFSTLFPIYGPGPLSPLESVNDCDVLVSDDLDSLAVVDAGGLRLLRLIAGTDTWAEAILDTSAWAGARIVRCADMNLDGKNDLVGVAANGTDILTMIDDGTGQYDPGPSSNSGGETILDLAPIEWRTTGIREVALLTAGGYRIRDLYTGEISQRTSPMGIDAIAVVPAAGGAQTEKLAWSTLHPNGTDTLLIVAYDGGWEPTVPIAGAVTDAMSAGDLTNDGYAELVLRHTSGDMLALHNSAGNGPTSFSNSDLENTTLENELGTPAIAPLVRDLAGNGYGDVVMPTLSGNPDTLTYWRDPLAPSSPYRDLTPAFVSEECMLTVQDVNTTDDATLTFLIDYQGPPGWSGEFQLIRHTQASLTANLDPIPTITYLSPLGNMDGYYLFSQSISFNDPASSSWLHGMDEANHLVLRAVDRDQGELIWASPAFVCVVYASNYNINWYSPHYTASDYPTAEQTFCDFGQSSVTAKTVCTQSGATPVGGQVGGERTEPGSGPGGFN